MPNLSLGCVLLQTVLICIKVGIMGEAVQRLEHRYHGSSAQDNITSTEFGTGDASRIWIPREFGTVNAIQHIT